MIGINTEIDQLRKDLIELVNVKASEGVPIASIKHVFDLLSIDINRALEMTKETELKNYQEAQENQNVQVEQENPENQDDTVEEQE